MKAVRSIDGIPTVVDVPKLQSGIQSGGIQSNGIQSNAVSASASVSDVRASAPDTSSAATSATPIRIKVESAGICGSDLHMLDLGVFNPEVTIGHEFAGRLPDGTPVAVEPVSSCGHCLLCQKGDYNLCYRAAADVLGFGRDGGMAEEVAVLSHQLVRLPSGASTQDACLVEPLAVCVRALRLAGVTGAQRLAIVGGGTIGQAALAVARHMQAPTTLIARHDRQKEAAERLGAEVCDPDALTDSSFAVVVDAAGTPDALRLATRLCEPAGTISLVSTYWSGLELPGTEICLKEIRLVPSIMYGRHAGGRDTESAAAILAANPEIPNAIVTHRFPLDGATEAFAVARDRSSGAIKVVLHP